MKEKKRKILLDLWCERGELNPYNLMSQQQNQGYTGANTKRPAFAEMMCEARKRKFDVLLVWKLDRLSRSLKDLISTLDEL